MKDLYTRWAFTTMWACAMSSMPWSAYADGLELHTPSPRSISRAGAVVVSEDGAGALYINPAGMARRDAWRVQLGASLLDRDLGYRPEPTSDDPDAEAGRAKIDDRGTPMTMPHLGVQGRFGPVIVGLGYLETSAVSARQPGPRAGQGTDEVTQLHPHRYAGLELDHRMRALFVGAAMRVKPWLGIGVSVGAARLSLGEKRHVWAGSSTLDEILDPGHDLVLEIQAADALVPRAGVGLLLAPLSLPLEMGISVSYTGSASASGTVSLTPLYDGGTLAVRTETPKAEVTLAQPLVVRTGIRYLGERISAEVSGELWLYRGSHPASWALSGLEVSDAFVASARLEQVDALARTRSHAVMRGALDYDVVPGFLWLSAGYAYSSGASANAWLSPVLASSGQHTAALGVEVWWGGTSVTVGYAREFAAATEIWLSGQRVANPFEPAGSAITGLGRYQTSSDRVGVAMEMAWE